jgi:hypothetical protein
LLLQPTRIRMRVSKMAVRIKDLFICHSFS